ncbi:phosphoglycerate mutase (2,3-diphosphoglycerate-independent) [Candidatus Saccharibacteria bacterium]|nr:phosphoglycerate mutase (2,3-diphosphoglycerate-independent) [Candidatus Saccharibacteria bacterium]
MNKLRYDGPVVLAILDGVGLAPDAAGNAVSKARTPFLGKTAREQKHIALEASGEAVGLLSGQMGNSEVGHNTMGAGQAVKQGVAKVNAAFSTGEVFESTAWQSAVAQVLKKPLGDTPRTLHFAGIFSDGGVHSDIYYLEQMISRAVAEGVKRIRVHAVLDGRDVGPFTAPKYIERFEKFASSHPEADIRLATGGGRMVYVADRYEDDWNKVAKGWDAMVNAEADYFFHSAGEAVETLRRIFPGIQDQDLPPFVLVDEKERPVGQVRAGDSLIYFDFRADRAIEIAQAFTYWDFPHFNRGEYKPTDVYFAGMTEYNSDTHVPEHRLIEPVKFGETLPKFLDLHDISQLACSETVKFGHVTYYFNGNSYEKGKKEEFLEIESAPEPYTARPWMRTAEITDAVVERMRDFDFVRLNFPGGDMVGHTADLDATVVAMEAIDISLKRLAEAVDQAHGVLIIVADHGNAEELIDADGEKKTSHKLNQVPCIIYDNTKNRDKYEVVNVAHAGLKNLAATLALILGRNIDELPKNWAEPLIKIK